MGRNGTDFHDAAYASKVGKGLSDAAAIPTTIRIAAASLESCHIDSSPATNDAGNQGKHRRPESRAVTSPLCFPADRRSQPVQEECRAQRWRTDSGRRCIFIPLQQEVLLDIKELPHSRQRPSCLSDKYDSDGVWDPEKWHASLYPNSGRSSPIDSLRKESDAERTSLKRRIADPRERVKEDDLDVVLSPQRRSFGGGCHVTAAVGSRRAGSPLDNKENERPYVSLVVDELRDYGDSKRVFGERRRNDSYTEEEPEWFSGGPTSQSETIELTGFDDKILEEDHKGRKRTRKRVSSVKEGKLRNIAMFFILQEVLLKKKKKKKKMFPCYTWFECNGGVLEEEGPLAPGSTADQEVPQEAVLTDPAPGEFDFNEFFNLDKSVPGLASMIEDVLGEGSVSASRFSRWFSNHSHSGSRSSSLRSTPHEELESLAGHVHTVRFLLRNRSVFAAAVPQLFSMQGLEQVLPSRGQNSENYFAPIHFEDAADKVDILEMLQKAKVDLKPLLSSLTANKEKLRERAEQAAGARDNRRSRDCAKRGLYLAKELSLPGKGLMSYPQTIAGIRVLRSPFLAPPSIGASREPVSEDYSDASLDQDFHHYQETLYSEPVNKVLKLEEEPLSKPDHAMSFKRTKRAQFLATHPEFKEIVESHKIRPDKQFTGQKPMESKYSFAQDPRIDWSQSPPIAPGYEICFILLGGHLY
ncbi:unnamed protein product [Ranitomeya imitator]|uniref:Uncharacterized protein n=1 Tax=Ranitomeya imitator TaxID=111125 RepID=A0ABN9MD00_9NEOB|nr:unnamed protein product [Ranitomeya imitator]